MLDLGGQQGWRWMEKRWRGSWKEEDGLEILAKRSRESDRSY